MNLLQYMTASHSSDWGWLGKTERNSFEELTTELPFNFLPLLEQYSFTSVYQSWFFFFGLKMNLHWSHLTFQTFKIFHGKIAPSVGKNWPSFIKMRFYFQGIKQKFLLSKRVNTLIFKLDSHFIHSASQMDFCWSQEGRTMLFPSHKREGAKIKGLLH